jgi:hypothetical protein
VFGLVMPCSCVPDIALLDSEGGASGLSILPVPELHQGGPDLAGDPGRLFSP